MSPDRGSRKGRERAKEKYGKLDTVSGSKIERDDNDERGIKRGHR
jgi:hypothetical protein